MNMELSHNVIRENVVYNEYECESKSFLAHPDPCCHAFRSEEKGVLGFMFTYRCFCLVCSTLHIYVLFLSFFAIALNVTLGTVFFCCLISLKLGTFV